MRIFISYVSGKPFWVSEFENIVGDPMKNLPHSVVEMANKLTENTTLLDFQLMIQHLTFEQEYSANL